MDAKKMQVIKRRQADEEEEEEEDIPLPGFRFHPTDEELVGFYLRRKVDKKPLNIHLIKQIDIYKYDPWDLPQASDAGENEWYFFCRRGRKYRNSIRPNRVTGSGFWKATGIDRPIYSGDGSVCIGLKKSLVYYRGSAGKGTKTEWMMHEFRLPPSSQAHLNTRNTNDMNESISQEAEVWTLCRILKRNVCHRKTLPHLKESSAKRNHLFNSSSNIPRGDSDDKPTYISFQPFNHHQQQHQNHHANMMNNLSAIGTFTSISSASSDHLAQSTNASSSSFSDQDMNEATEHGDWDDLRSVVEFAAADRPVFFM